MLQLKNVDATTSYHYVLSGLIAKKHWIKETGLCLKFL